MFFFCYHFSFLLLPRLSFIGIENKQSKGLNNWEWDVFVGQIQLIIFIVLITI